MADSAAQNTAEPRALQQLRKIELKAPSVYVIMHPHFSLTLSYCLFPSLGVKRRAVSMLLMQTGVA